MIDLSNIKNYYIACGYTDLRRGIDGLAQIVMLQYGYEIDENSLFLFCGRRTDMIIPHSGKHESAGRKTCIRRKENIDTRRGKRRFAQGTQ